MTRRLWLCMCTGIGIAFLTQTTLAETLETNFYRLPIDPSWTVSRTANGLWQLEIPEPIRLQWTLLVARPRTDPELYLQATMELWQVQGDLKVQQDSDRLQGLILPRDGSDAILKRVQWRDGVFFVATCKFPVEHVGTVSSVANTAFQNLELKDGSCDLSRLEKQVREFLVLHPANGQGPQSLTAAREAMTEFRQDWEPCFGQDRPPLYSDFLAYLESCYDAAYAREFGPELGFPPTVLESRLESVKGRYDELVRGLNLPTD